MIQKRALFSGMILLFLVACGGRVDEPEYTLNGRLVGSGNGHLPAAQIPLSVASVSPAGLSSGNYRDVAIDIGFDQIVQISTLTTNADTVCSGNIQLSASATFSTCVPFNSMITRNSTTNVYRLRPAELLQENTTYYLKIKKEIKSYLGFTMLGDYNASFSTGSNALTPLLEEVGPDCSAGGNTIAQFKTAAGGTEGDLGPFSINGLVLTGIDRNGSFYLQKGNEAIFVDVTSTTNSCASGVTCKAALYGLQIGDELCMTITRGVETNFIDTVKNFNALRKTGLSSIAPLELTDVYSNADLSRLVRIKGFLTTKFDSGNVNQILTFADRKSIVLRDNSSGKFSPVELNEFIEVTSIASQFSTTPQITIDTALGMILQGLTAPEYRVTGSVNGWESGEDFTLSLNGEHEAIISANGLFSFSGNPLISGEFNVTMSAAPASSLCAISNSTGFATIDYSLVSITCAKNPVFIMFDWSVGSAAGTYPTYEGATLFFKESAVGVVDPALATAVGANYTRAYNLTSGGRLFGNDDNGFSFRITGTSEIKPMAADLALDLTGKTNVRVRWTGVTWSDAGANREYRIRLEYSTTGCSGSFTASGMEYTRAASGSSYPVIQTLGPTTLAALNGQANVCLRWRYYQAAGSSGNRPWLGVDDIIVQAD